MARVAIQQQQRLFREGLRQVLAAENDMEVCATAATGQELVEVCAEQHPELVVLEADASGWDVPRLCAGVRRVDPRVRLVGLSAGPCTPAEVSAAERSGMWVLISRGTGVPGILQALRAAAAGPQRGNVAVLRGPSSAETPARPVLTARELGVLHLVGAGCTSREISGRLGISHKTVENHKQRVFGKLGVQNQAHAVSVAMRAGLLRADHVLDLALAD